MLPRTLKKHLATTLITATALSAAFAQANEIECASLECELAENETAPCPQRFSGKDGSFKVWFLESKDIKAVEKILGFEITGECDSKTMEAARNAGLTVIRNPGAAIGFELPAAP